MKNKNILLVASILLAALPTFAADIATNTVPPLKQSKSTVRVAVAQMNIKPKDLKAGQDAVDLLQPWITRAVAEKADLLVFPEYVLGAFHLPDKLTDKLCAAAKAGNLNLIVGGWEFLPGVKIQQPPEPNTYANCLLVVGRDGKIAGKHWKMHAALGGGSPYCWPPDPGERGENTMVLGKENGVVDLDIGRVGLLTCYDGYFFESFEMPSLRGAEILVWPNGRLGMIEPHLVKAASFLTCTHVVAANQSIGCGSTIIPYPGWGVAAVADKPGEEKLIFADLDMAMLRQQRLNSRMFHQRRPEAYTTITQKWEPWTAYPDLKPFSHADKAPDEKPKN